MKANIKDIFKKIIKQAPADHPTADFTDVVMKTVEAEVERELVLKAILQQQPAEGPTFDFTAGIMAQINADAQRNVYKPIITRKVWFSIAATIAVFLVLIGLSNTSKQASTVSLTASALKYINAVPPVFLMAFVAGGILLLVDYLITQRGKKAEVV